MIKKILIGIDNGKYAENAAQYGFKLAHTLNAQVGLVHITEPMAIAMESNGADTILGVPLQGLNTPGNLDILNIQSEVSENMITLAAKKYAGDLQVTHFNEYGSTAEGIITCGDEFKADLIVLGTHHRSGFDRLVMGDIAEEVLRQSHIPVLVVPMAE